MLNESLTKFNDIIIKSEKKTVYFNFFAVKFDCHQYGRIKESNKRLAWGIK